MLLHHLRKLLQLRPQSRTPLAPEESARQLIAAIDAGGIPLNAARVNHIARQLGLDVASTAPVEVTIARIRKTLQR